MAVPKLAKIAIWIGGFVSLIVLLAVLATYWIVESGGYIQRNPKKMIAHLEKIFEINFPEDIKDARAAESWMEWDNYRSYIIKFRVDPNVLDSFVKMDHLMPYDPTGDERLKSDIFPMPKWYRQPIQKGKMGSLTLDSPRGKVEGRADIYIDTSDEKSFVVYIADSYHRSLDKLAR